MKVKGIPFAIALAACSYSLAADAKKITTIQVCPAGVFYPMDGRKLDVPGWRIDAASAQAVIDRFNARITPLVIDYEHQTLNKATNGQPAPAAAWFRSLQWREGQGLFAEIELTPNAHAAVANREYLFFSPVFRYDPKTGEVLAIEMGALTNTPAIDGMEEMSLRAAACFGATPEEDNVNLLQLLISALGLSAATTESEAIAALNQRLTQNDLTALRTTLGVDATADVGTMVAACTALRETATPDPAKYVPITGLTELQGQVAVLNQKLAARDAQDVDGLVDAALEDGRLVKGLESWARDLGKKDVAALNSYLTAAQPFAKLLASQTNGAAPVVDETTGLTTDELAVCNNMGITAAEFVAAKAAS